MRPRHKAAEILVALTASVDQLHGFNEAAA